MYSDSVYHMLLPQFIMYYSWMHYIILPLSHDLNIQCSHHQPQRRCQPRNLNQPRKISAWYCIYFSEGRGRNHSAIAARRAITIHCDSHQSYHSNPQPSWRNSHIAQAVPANISHLARNGIEVAHRNQQ
jgi:hypothetical protein